MKDRIKRFKVHRRLGVKTVLLERGGAAPMGRIECWQLGLSAQRIYQDLVGENGFGGSY